MFDHYPQPLDFSDDDILAEPILKFFHYAHLPANRQMIGELFFYLAVYVYQSGPISDERTMALRKLLEARDCAIRAALP